MAKQDAIQEKGQTWLCFHNGPMLTLQIVNIILFVGIFVVNSLAGAVGLLNETVGGVSDSLPNRLVPAGYAFLIWNLIYFANAVFIIWQALPSSQNNEKAIRIGWLNPILSVVNIGWIFAWLAKIIWLSLILIIAFLAVLIVIQIRIGTYVPGFILRVHVFFSVYLGWLTVATAVNITVTFVAYMGPGVTLGWTAEAWSVTIQLILFALAIIINLLRRDGIMTLVFTWALVAIGQNQADSMLVSTTAYVLASMIGVLSVISLVTGFIERSRLQWLPKSEITEHLRTLRSGVDNENKEESL